jgi:hypothetical protein
MRTLVASVFLVLAWTAVAAAQKPTDVVCKSTETQPECHARLKCRPYEELDECQKRILKCSAMETLEQCVKRGGGDNSSSSGGDNANDRGNDDRGNDRGNDNRNNDNRNSDRSNDRGNDDRGNDRSDERRSDRGRDRSDRGRRGRSDGGSSRGRRGRRSGGGGGRGFEANKTFGLGLEVGEPTGLTGKVFLSPRGALDFGVGYIYSHYYYGDGGHVYLDYLAHPVSLASTPSFELPFYIGGGLRFWNFDYCDPMPNPDVCYRGSAVGIRIPLGLALDFNNVPLDIFLQLVPTFDFLSGDYYDHFDDRNHFGFDVSAGIRFWFK